VNIKVDKGGNDAIAAINKLYNDYVVTDPELEKCYLVLKIGYSFKFSEKDGKRKLSIDSVSSFFLEEIDHRTEHQQDSRSWSRGGNRNSGRLLASEHFRKQHRLYGKDISYESTRSGLQRIFESNLKENQKQNANL
jgi:hypothetical protein